MKFKTVRLLNVLKQTKMGVILSGFKLKRDEPVEGKCASESDTDHLLIGRITFDLHISHLEHVFSIISVLNQS